ncbi:hypothetical protein F5Y15DRAFT_414936 [Xylariaceae sp. FL0016]|nr:hypothetical protein F5Y15DRAFT_414936 [Xylariaceae sp. FL0016]
MVDFANTDNSSDFSLSNWFTHGELEVPNDSALPDFQKEPSPFPALPDPMVAFPSVSHEASSNETRMLLLLILSRLDTLERIANKTDSALDRVLQSMSIVSSSMESMKIDLQKFAADMIGFLRGCGLLPGDRSPRGDEELGQL